MAKRPIGRTSAQQVRDRFLVPKPFVYYRDAATPKPVKSRK